RRRIHAAALIAETIGALLIFLEAKWLVGMVELMRFVSFDGEPQRLNHWYYHRGGTGFGFLLCGIVLSATLLGVEHPDPPATTSKKKPQMRQKRARKISKKSMSLPGA
ncbi:MAG: hypothetical protein JWM99_989, partial [Verrucomicrobiales bacterium]|nr:hypothetical protein [Verrucomicrobiales bacterium]